MINGAKILTDGLLHTVNAQEFDPHDLQLVPFKAEVRQFFLGHLQAAGFATPKIVEDL